MREKRLCVQSEATALNVRITSGRGEAATLNYRITSGRGSLYRYAFCKIARFIYIAFAVKGGVISEKLSGNYAYYRR